MKYLLLLAALMFTFGAPVADAAPRKGKKAKTQKKVKKDEDELMTAEEYEAEQARLAEEEANAPDTRSGAERREDNKMLMEETKWYISNQKKTLKILRSVRNEKSAAKAVKPLEKIYGEVMDDFVVGEVTALGTAKVMEEDEEKLPVHQASRATAAALNKAINKEIQRISELGIEHKKFNGAMKNMIDSQR
ncbi:MAG: hypothetical protein IKA23_06525 [Akkermansia sp.]|nr:hypothetical protein [Akkermansia sp.]MBR2313896.1 hypothetical protein [Akkermansia sp.]